MATTRYNDGSVTVTLDGGLEAFVRSALESVAGETVRLMEEAAEEVAAKARADWYAPGTGVRRLTGRTGDVQVITTISDSEIRVSVGSTDKGAIYVHRPGRLSTRPTEITSDDYAAAKRKGGIPASLVFHARRANKASGVESGHYYRLAHNPDASDGKYLLPVLIRAPMKAKIRAITPELGRSIAARLKR